MNSTHASRRPGPKRLLFALIAAALVLTTIELSAMLALSRLGQTPAPPQPARTWSEFLSALPDSEIEIIQRDHYDSRLGWDVRPGYRGIRRKWSYRIDRLGARRDDAWPLEQRISSYGDSFTFGSQVEDHQTYPAFLSRLAETRVLNFGVFGYGTDQALLKLERHLADGVRSSIVILGINDGNIRRLMNAYRPFIIKQSRIRLGFKPMFVEDGTEYALAENPLARFESRADMHRALDTAMGLDWFYNHPFGEVSFPFSASAYLALARRAASDAHDDPRQPSWRHRESVGKMRFVIRRFAALAQQHGFRAVVLFIPSGHNVRRRANGREHDYAAFVRELENEYGELDLIVVDMLRTRFDPERFHVRRFDAHASPYGNRIIAQTVFDRIQVVLARNG